MLLTERLARQAATLTGSEKALADDLTRHYPHGVLESATAIAARTGTSASTVVRLTAKLGYGSFSEVQREARGTIAALLQTAGQRAPVALGTDRTLVQCVDDTLHHDQENLAATRDGLDMEAFAGMVERLAQGRGRVFVMAQKNSAPVAAYLAVHLNLCLPGVQELGAGALQAADQLLWIAPEDVLLAFTIRRYSHAPVQVARQFREQGGSVLAITDSPAAPVAAWADHCLLVRTGNASPFDSYTAAFFLCNALVSAVAQARRAALQQALQRRDTLWKSFEADPLDGISPVSAPR